MSETEGRKGEGVVDVLNMEMHADSDLGNVMDSAKDIGELLGNVFSVLNNRDRIKMSGNDYAKLLGTVGLTFGSIIDGAQKAQAIHSKKLMLPSEVNAMLRKNIGELEETKESVKLQSKLTKLMKEVAVLPVTKEKLPTDKKEVLEAIEIKRKEIDALRKSIKKGT